MSPYTNVTFTQPLSQPKLGCYFQFSVGSSDLINSLCTSWVYTFDSEHVRKVQCFHHSFGCQKLKRQMMLLFVYGTCAQVALCLGRTLFSCNRRSTGAANRLEKFEPALTIETYVRVRTCRAKHLFSILSPLCILRSVAHSFKSYLSSTMTRKSPNASHF